MNSSDVLELPNTTWDKELKWNGGSYTWILFYTPVVILLMILILMSTTKYLSPDPILIISLQGGFLISTTALVVIHLGFKQLNDKGYVKLFRRSSYMLVAVFVVNSARNSVILVLTLFSEGIFGIDPIDLTSYLRYSIYIEIVVLTVLSVLWSYLMYQHYTKKPLPDSSMMMQYGTGNVQSGDSNAKLLGLDDQFSGSASYGSFTTTKEINQELVVTCEAQRQRIKFLSKQLLQLQEKLNQLEKSKEDD
eukprot:TRINITY_DN511_c0_g1_i1.p1 TRINITY_DN511_c0_g1~~TRINITY_DN511_c0_g1_i1.p1  ORF type:complete len:249 (+),score=25.33 TRINITY_DN511_c0_g1_i1:7-753(+)